VTYAADPRVDAYVAALPDWQQDICCEVRDLVHAADPEVTETIKRTNRPYFVLEGNICDAINAPALTAMFEQIIANNRAGGWRKLKPES
jgi:hypothetical protein